MKLFTDCLHKHFNKKCGIYLFTCKKHFYIGSSINIYYRIKRHTSDMQRKQHQNRYVQNVFNKYGKDKFFFTILEECSEEEVILRETYYIQKYKPTLNSDQCPISRTFTAETVEQIRNTLLEGYKSGRITPTNMKEVHRYELTGEYVDSFYSVSEAGRVLGFSFKKISRATKSVKHSSFGYRWSYKKMDKLR